MCAPSFQRLQRLSIPVTESGCWLWTAATNKDGYGKVKINRRHMQAHRWSWALHNGDIPQGIQVLHKCDVPACVNPDHLFLGTNQDNVDDRESKGRGYKIPIYRNPKITEAQAREIKKLRGIVRIVDLASRYGLHYSQISRIQTGRYWAHLGATERMG